MVADFFMAAGAERIMSVDLHSGQVQGFFDGPVDHLTAVPLLTAYLRANLAGDFVMVSPDTGRTKTAEKAARNAGDVDMASVYKRRSVDRVGHVEALDVMGDVRGRMCVLIDDEIDTAGTLCEAAKILYQKGATDVWATATHGLFSEPAIDRLKNSNISRVVVTDTVPLPSEKQIEKIESVSVSKTFADAIRAVFEEGSVSEIFGGENQN
jgi:ribose-phosphate pyrophosphokinase